MEDGVRQLAAVCGMRLVSDPFDVDALFTKGLILAKLGNIKRAVEILNSVMASNPEYPGGWRVLGTLYEMMGNLEMSRECIDKSSLYVE
ncbi:MAG: hypothetical protein JSV43_09110 [Methanobacteriota archaeon]|nr:MAG: hypothetical protein JSV43_09110 [Euryarchaeota archaeon]